MVKVLKCAWCGKPAIGFLARLPHCGRSHIVRQQTKQKRKRGR